VSGALVPHVAGPGVTMACGSGHCPDCGGWLLPADKHTPAERCACTDCEHPNRKKTSELRYEQTWFGHENLPDSKPFQR
jgi:hypothetical protein